MSSPSLDAGNTILVLTHPDTVPAVHDFVQVLVNPDVELPPQPSSNSRALEDRQSRTVEWTIDNKYYTAGVCFVIHPYDNDTAQAEGTLLMEEKLKDCPAVIYTYTCSEHFPPSTFLVESVTAANPELCFGIRIPHALSYALKGTTAQEEQYDPISEEEQMDSLGMEYIDFSSLYNPNRKVDQTDSTDTALSTTTSPREALQQLSDSLQTIMWPSMRRKAAPSVRCAPRAHESPVGTEHTAEQFFPVVFPSDAAFDDAAPPPPPLSTALPNHFVNEDPMQKPRPGISNPDSGAYVNPFDLSPQREDALLAREREELDTWLNTDTETKSDVESHRAGRKSEQVVRVMANDEKEQLVGNEQGPKGGFDDDFGAWDIRKLVDRALVGEGVDAEADDDEFSAFQSAPDKSIPKPHAAASYAKSGDNENDNIGFSSRPAVSASDDINDSDDDSGIPIDPTALLSHLQSLRVELAGVEDEDERRARAGREVVDVMRGLGIRLDDLDLDLDLEGGGL